MGEKRLGFIKDGQRRKMIKCPACWQEINDDESVCPKCGFVLKVGYSNNVEIDIQNDNWNGTQSYNSSLSNYQNLNSDYSPVKKNNSMKSKDKAIISIAVAAIIFIIFAFAIPKNNSRNKNDYYSSYSNDNNYNYSYSSGATTGKEGALNRAKSYLNTSAFSESGLQEQLEYEGFTTEEAKYGVSNCGADWKQQASKKAASYLRSHSGWSRSELIDQLEYEGFTYDQASYGASQNGL